MWGMVLPQRSIGGLGCSALFLCRLSIFGTMGETVAVHNPWATDRVWNVGSRALAFSSLLCSAGFAMLEKEACAPLDSIGVRSTMIKHNHRLDMDGHGQTQCRRREAAVRKKVCRNLMANPFCLVESIASGLQIWLDIGEWAAAH